MDPSLCTVCHAYCRELDMGVLAHRTTINTSLHIQNVVNPYSILAVCFAFTVLLCISFCLSSSFFHFKKNKIKNVPYFFTTSSVVLCGNC